MGLLSMLRVHDHAPAARRRRHRFTPSLQLGADVLESRLVLSAAPAAPAAVAPAAPVGKHLPIQVTSVTIDPNVFYNATTKTLSGTGTVAGVLAGVPNATFSTPMTFSIQDPPPGQTCPILSLHLDPIHISLLGLHVDTSSICLDITATQGGGILGNLLCSLDGGLGGLLTNPTGGATTLTPTGATTLTNIISPILSNSLSQAVGRAHPGGPGSDSSVCTGDCEVLDLTLGPIDLHLLGLNVHLDNCNNGPVEICISATASEGLLGSLLCSLADRPGALSLTRVLRAITSATSTTGGLV